MTDIGITPNTSLTGGPATYVLASGLSSYINNDESTVNADLGTNVILTDYVSGGTAPYAYAWYTPTTTAPPLTGPTVAYCESNAPVIQGGTNPQLDTNNTLWYAIPSSVITTTGTYYFPVLVTDSTGPGAPSQACEVATVIVEPMFSGTFTIDGFPGQGQVGSPALQAVITFKGGSPWYAVTIYSGTDSLCANLKTVVKTANDITGNESILSFPEPSTPSSITYYCAVISDSTGNSITLGGSTPGEGVQVVINPALSVPVLTLMPSSTDFGVTVPVTATVSWAGGTAPYYVSLWKTSSSSCLQTGAPAFPYPGTGPTSISGGSISVPFSASTGDYTWTTSGYTMSFTFPSPTSTTFYCAVVVDSSAPFPAAASAEVNAAGAEFLVEGLFAVNPPTASSYLTEVQTPVYEGTPDTITATWSGGSGPFIATLYQYFGTSAPTAQCGTAPWALAAVNPGSNPVTGITASSGTESASFTVVLEPTGPGNYYFCSVVTDTSVPITLYSGASLKPVVVASYLGSVTLSTPSPPNVPGFTPGTDTGQSESFYIVVGWSGGSAPYTVTLTSGSTAATCGSTTVATQTGVAGLSTKFQVTSPTASTYYCATVTDSSLPQSANNGGPLPWLTQSPPSIAFAVPSYEIEAGMGTTLTPIVVSYGTSPDFVQYFIGAGCASGSAITGQLPNPVTGFSSPTAAPTYNTGVLTTTTTYSVLLTDSSTGTPALSSCANIVITVNNGPTAVVAVNSGPYAGLVYSTCTSSAGLCVIDTDSNSLVAVIPIFGSYTSGLPNPSDPLTSINGVAFDSGNNWIWVTGTDGSGVGYVCDVLIQTNTERSCLGPINGVQGTPEGLAYDSGLGRLIVAESGVNLAYVYNEVTDTAASYPVGAGPLNVAVDQNTHTVFVTNYGSNTVSVLQPNLVGGYTVTTVNVGFEPFGVAVDPATDNVWVTNSGSGTVSVLNGFNYNTLQTIKVGGNPTGIAISDANNEALVANEATNTVTPISLTTFAPGTPVAVGSTPMGVADFLSGVSGIPSLAYVANSGSNTVSVINLATGAVIATIILPG